MAEGSHVQALAARYRAVRERSLELAAPLSAEDCCAQSMPDASPVKWHLAHTTWFFDTFVLQPHEADYTPHDPSFRVLFNSYYNGVGARHPRAQRGLLTRPALGAVLDYRRAVDARMDQLLAQGRADLDSLVELGLQHEQQHQELLLTDVKHLLSAYPAGGAYVAGQPQAGGGAPLAWIAHPGGLADCGHDGNGFCFDNELPRHRQWIAPFALADRLVTNAEYLEFIEDGGYADPSLWLSEGWDAVCEHGWAHPLYWSRGEHGWMEFTLHGLQPLAADCPVTHVSLYEADAYAQWLRRRVPGVRLPTEFEWEHAAATHRFDAAPSLHPAGAMQGAGGLRQLDGHCWQWTASSYAPFPGFAPAAGAIGEYNGKFMINQYVLRGGSCATPAGHTRATYRNFFPAGARWQFTGIRLARSLS